MFKLQFSHHARYIVHFPIQFVQKLGLTCGRKNHHGRITAEWRGAEPTSGLGVVLDLYIPKPNLLKFSFVNFVMSKNSNLKRGRSSVHLM
jgi:hypothetical protein